MGISILALVLSCISLFWQVSGHFRNLNFEVIDIFESLGDMGMQYIFRINILNRSYSAISISKINVVIGDTKLPFDYQCRTLAEGVKEGALNKGEKIRSTELPLNIGGSEAAGGFFYILDSDDMLKLTKPVEEKEFKVEFVTSRGSFTKTLTFPKVTPIHALKP